jgi:competence protein ComEC
VKQAVACFAIVAGLSAAVVLGAERKTLDIYFIDVEGGQSTLVVTPSGQTLLIDAGWAGAPSGGRGRMQGTPGDPHLARDDNRIVAAARDAGVTRIDYLLITHFHPDHIGGVVELAQLIPIGTLIDHGSVNREDEESVPGTLAAFSAYAAVRAKSRQVQPNPGDHLPLKGVDAVVVSSALTNIVKPFAGAGESNPVCATPAPDVRDRRDENVRSTGIRMQFGKFRFLDVGDLGGKPLRALVCPTNLVGSVDAYLVAHHGGTDAADAATFAAFKPRVAILNNGEIKGGTIKD